MTDFMFFYNYRYEAKWDNYCCNIGLYKKIGLNYLAWICIHNINKNILHEKMKYISNSNCYSI